MISSRSSIKIGLMKPLSSLPPTPPEPALSAPGKEPLPFSSQEDTHPEGSSLEPLTESDLPSTPGQEIDQFLETLRKLPEVRQERIRMIQKNIQRGIYSVSSENLADKIIQELQPPAQESSPPSTS